MALLDMSSSAWRRGDQTVLAVGGQGDGAVGVGHGVSLRVAGMQRGPKAERRASAERTARGSA